ncbi:MAG: multidrug effflux MFS transporter [Pseudomonadota bacterium]
MPHPAKPAPAFVPMIALMMSMVALSTDIMLPALPAIAADLSVAGTKDVHLVVTTLFLGFGMAQLFVGPMADTWGRKPVVLGSFVLVIMGAVICAVAPTFETLLLGRFIQGIGIAGPRVLATTIVRDIYAGPTMARMMSIVMLTFIMVPIFAPALGQGVQALAGWRSIFGVLAAASLVSAIWYGVAQAETLAPENQRPFTPVSLYHGLAEVIGTRASLGHTMVSGFMFGPFLAYLAGSQMIYQDIYAAGALFPLYFALGAGSIGIAALTNSILVERAGVVFLARRAFQIGVLGVAIFVLWSWAHDGTPPLWSFIAFVMLTFFCIGLNFGNVAALALEPMGHMAGMASAVFGFLSTMMSIPIAWVLGAVYAGTTTPLAVGFMICGILALATFEWAVRGRAP